MANQTVIVGGKEIPIVNPKLDLDIASRLIGGKYRRPAIVGGPWGFNPEDGRGSFSLATKNPLNAFQRVRSFAEVSDGVYMAAALQVGGNDKTCSFTLNQDETDIDQLVYSTLGYGIDSPLHAGITRGLAALGGNPATVGAGTWHNVYRRNVLQSTWSALSGSFSQVGGTLYRAAVLEYGSSGSLITLAQNTYGAIRAARSHVPNTSWTTASANWAGSAFDRMYPFVLEDGSSSKLLILSIGNTGSVVSRFADPATLSLVGSAITVYPTTAFGPADGVQVARVNATDFLVVGISDTDSSLMLVKLIRADFASNTVSEVAASEFALSNTYFNNGFINRGYAKKDGEFMFFSSGSLGSATLRNLRVVGDAIEIGDEATLSGNFNSSGSAYGVLVPLKSGLALACFYNASSSDRTTLILKF